MIPKRLDGQLVDMGDILIQTRWILKGKHPRFVFHIGPVMDTTPADRVVTGTSQPATGGVDLIMDLMADKKVPLTLDWTDELGNSTPAPADGVVSFSVDDPALINLTDNGDGTAVAAAVGTLGTTHVNVSASTGGVTMTGVLEIVVVAGLAERVNIVAGTPEEVTPDV